MQHVPGLLVILAMVFLAIIIGYFVWGIEYIVSESTKATKPPASANQIPSFNIPAAANLDYRGTLPQMPDASSTGS